MINSNNNGGTRPVMRYYGGKFRIASEIVALMPEHDIYVEPFGGAASVLLSKPVAACEIYNDLCGDVVNVFRQLRDSGEALLDLLLTLEGKVIMSGYDHPIYRTKLADWNVASFDARDQRNRARKELVWMNYEPEAMLL